MNVVSLVGRATIDPEIITYGSRRVAKFRIAIDRAGDKDPETGYLKAGFFDIEGWGEASNLIERFVKKGSLVYVNGNLRHHVWEDGGTKRSKIYVDVVDLGPVRITAGNRQDGDKPNAQPTDQSKEGDPEINRTEAEIDFFAQL